MTAATVAAALAGLKTRAGTVCQVFDPGKVPDGGPVDAQGRFAPHAILHPSPGTPTDRMLDATTPWRLHVHRLIAVSNNASGARILTGALVDAIDGHLHAGSAFFVEVVSDPIDDRDDPAAVLWTSTLEIHHHT